MLINDGVYQLTKRIDITGNQVTYKGVSGNREAVVIRGNGPDGSIDNIFSIKGDNVYIENLKIGEVKRHAIQIHGENSVDKVLIRNVHFYDTGEQMLKGSFDKKKPKNFISNGLVENCLFEFTKGKAFQFYTGGIDVHHGENWVIKNNVFKNIRNPGEKLTEGAIHFWNQSRNINVLGNRIINCDRGIMFGLDDSPFYVGLIMNNFIHVVDDTGIYLCNASDVKVLNNSIFIDSKYPNAIEYRFKNTINAIIANNLTNRAIQPRDGGSAQVMNNVVSAKAHWFVNSKEGDLHLDEKIDSVQGKGIVFPEVVKDIDEDIRKPGAFDIGADENNTIRYKPIERLVLSSDKSSIWSDGFQFVAFQVQAVYKDGKEKSIDPDQIECVNEKVKSIDAGNPVFSFDRPGTYRFRAKLNGIDSNTIDVLVYDILEKQVSDLNVWQVEGQTFLTFGMISDYILTQEITYGEYFKKKKQIKTQIKYNIYRSKDIIKNINGLTPIASVDSFTGWNDSFYGINTNSDRYSGKKVIRYTVKPDKGCLDSGRGLFVFSPADEGNFYYAVTTEIKGRENKDVIIGQNSMEIPVKETKGPGSPILQRVESPKTFQYIKKPKLYFYTKWESPPNSSRNSQPLDYLVAIPENLKKPAPVGIHLHSWGGNLLDGYAWWNNAEKGAILLATNQYPYDWWTGYHESLFSKDPPRSKKDWQNGVVRPYTINRLFSFLEYLDKKSDWPIDTSRTFTAGSSMGGSGSLMMAIRYPERVAWSRSWVGVHIPDKSPQFKSSYMKVWGDPEFNVKFEDGTPVWDYYNNAKYLYENPKKEIGFLTFCNGKNDGAIGWAQAVEFLKALQDTRRPHLFIWGQGRHGQRTVMPGNGSERVMPLDIRTDMVLPAFTHCSLDNNPGNGDPNDGDPSGQINQWLFWEDKSIVDEQDRFEITVALMEKAPAPECTVDITPRRVQKFLFASGRKLFWKNTSNNGAESQKGAVTVDEYGLITLKKIVVSKNKNHIIVIKDLI